MSEPDERVREILADIRSSLASLQTNTAVLDELRYLNRALTGGTAQLPPPEIPNNLWGATFYDTYPTEDTRRPLAELVRKGLMTETTGIFGDPIRPQFLAEMFRYNFYDNDYADFRTQFNALRLTVDDLRSAALSYAVTDDTPTSEGGMFRLLWEIAKLLSQVFPLASGNDIYSALIAVKDASERAADCCEGGDGQPTNEPPTSTGDCEGWGTYIRASGYVFVADVDDGLGGDLQTLYDVEFDFSGEPWFQSMGTSGGRLYYEIAGTDDLTLEYCHARNFTGTLTCRTSGPDFGTTIADATNSTYTVAPDGFQVQELHDTVDIGDTAGERRYFGFSAQFPRGEVPPLNIWFKARYVVS